MKKVWHKIYLLFPIFSDRLHQPNEFLPTSAFLLCLVCFWTALVLNIMGATKAYTLFDAASVSLFFHCIFPASASVLVTLKYENDFLLMHTNSNTYTKTPSIRKCSCEYFVYMYLFCCFWCFLGGKFIILSLELMLSNLLHITSHRTAYLLFWLFFPYLTNISVCSQLFSVHRIIVECWPWTSEKL